MFLSLTRMLAVTWRLWCLSFMRLAIKTAGTLLVPSTESVTWMPSHSGLISSTRSSCADIRGSGSSSGSPVTLGGFIS